MVLTDWILVAAKGVSADGLTIVGWGTNAGMFEAGIAHFPRLAAGSPQRTCDFNQDGDENGREIPMMIAALVGNSDDPTMPCRADLNGDGFFLLEDVWLLVDCLLANG